MAQLSRLFLRAPFVIASLSFGVLALFAQAPDAVAAPDQKKPSQSIEKITPEKAQKIDQLLLSLNLGTDTKQVSAALKELAQYPYSEVQVRVTAFLTEILKGTSVHPGFSYALTSGLETLTIISTNENKAATWQLYSAFQSSNLAWLTTAGVKSRVEKAFDSLLEAVEKAPSRTLPSFRAAAVIEAPTEAPIAASGARSATPNKSAPVGFNQLLNAFSPTTSVVQLLQGIEANLYADAVSELNRKKSLPSYFGRDAELSKLVQALQRTEKSHVLLTGKAGTGKTTILKMAQNAWIMGTHPYPGQSEGKGIPIILELSVLDITNPHDPNRIKDRIQGARELSEKLGRHVILFVDEAHVATPIVRNSLKSFLTEEVGQKNLVHFVWATTSAESRTFMSDKAFSRRWVEIEIPEFDRERTIEAIKISALPRWKEKHHNGEIALATISDDAYDYAVKYGQFEQPHAGNPAAAKELLEATIVYYLSELTRKNAEGESLSESQKKFTITPDEIRNYMKFQLGLKLLPGDKEFDQRFDQMWQTFEKDYVGNDGLKHLFKSRLKNYFGTLHRDKMVGGILFGPPGGGKSYLAERVSEIFFSTKPLVINGAEYSEGGLSLNKLIGSPTGTVGSEQQRSVLSQYIKENPRGGVIVLEEADFAHQDVFNFFVNMITQKEFQDGLGQTWKTDRFILLLTTNVGQDRLIAKEGKGRSVTWEDLETRRRTLLTSSVMNGESVETFDPRALGEIFDEFIAKVSKESNPRGDTSAAIQNGEKWKRRFDAYYVLPPTQEELKAAAHNMVSRFVSQSEREYGVRFEIETSDIESILDLKSFRFEEGHGFVSKQLNSRLMDHLRPYLSRRGEVFEVRLDVETHRVGKKELSGLSLVVQDANGKATNYSLGISLPAHQNPWFHNPDMMKRIREFPARISQHIKGQTRQISEIHSMLKEKAINWPKRLVITQIGTSGNGKTELGYSMAEVLFGKRDAAFKVSGISRWGDLHAYVRSDAGFSGSNEETEFEKWFLSRKSAGGGVIILDELLSFQGLSKEEVGAKIGAINKLYDWLDEGKIKFGSRFEDASGFVILITGNAMQEYFSGIDDSPQAERQVQRRLAQITEKDIVEYFGRIGIDAPKVARFGKIFVNGPLPKEIAQEVGIKEAKRAIDAATRELSALYDIDVDVDPKIIHEIVDRVSTVKLGMRRVDRAIKDVVVEPIAGILIDMLGSEKITASLVDGKIVWHADGVEVVRVAQNQGATETWIPVGDVKKDDRLKTPQLKDVTLEPKVVLSPLQVHVTAVHEIYGHWMVSYLLNGENGTEEISLIPSDEYLGQVLFSDQSKSFEAPTLVTWLKNIAVLEAGHRAVFMSRIYASGGGGDGKRSADGAASDDLGKVEATLEQILSNQIFDEFREFGDPKNNHVFKSFMRSVGKQMADRLIRYGKRSGAFDELFLRVKEERFITGEKINEMMDAADKSKRLADPDSLFIWALGRATTAAVRKFKNDPQLSSQMPMIESLAKEVLRKSKAEIDQRIQFSGGKNAERVTETYKRALGGLKGAGLTCSSLFQDAKK